MLAALLMMTQLQLGEAPLARIGVADGDTLQTLYNVVRAEEGSNGHLYVLQNGIPYVAVFDSLGRRVGTVGRGGGGPGEFTAPVSVSFVGDSIWVADAGLGKFSVYDAAFRHGRDVILAEAFPFLRTGARVHPLNVLADGSFTIARVDSVSTILLIRQDGSHDVILATPVADYTARVAVGNHVSMITKPITTTTFAVAVGIDVMIVNRSEPGGVVVRSGTEARSSLTVNLRRHPIAEADVKAAVARFVESAKVSTPSVSTARLEAAYVQAINAPDSSYFITGAIADANGTLWLRQEPPRASETSMIKVDAVRGMVGESLSVPRGKRVMSIRGNSGWLLETDEDDVPYLVRYRLVR